MHSSGENCLRARKSAVVRAPVATLGSRLSTLSARSPGARLRFDVQPAAPARQPEQVTPVQERCKKPDRQAARVLDRAEVQEPSSFLAVDESRDDACAKVSNFAQQSGTNGCGRDSHKRTLPTDGQMPSARRREEALESKGKVSLHLF